MLKKRTLSIAALLMATLGAAVFVASACSPSRAGNRPTLVYFRAANCPYCKKMTPVVDEIGQQYGRQLHVVYAEVDQQQGKDLASQYGIIGYPTILLLDSEGERAGLLRGVVPRPTLEKMVDDLLQAQQ